MTARRRTTGAIVAGIIVLAGLVGLWFHFHTLPRQSELRRALREADALEVRWIVDGKTLSQRRIEDKETLRALADDLVYQQWFWRFADEPVRSIVVQTFQDQRPGLMCEVREQTGIYQRKAVRWYFMPVEPRFVDRVRGLLPDEPPQQSSGDSS